MSIFTRRPDGFRAVRMRGKTEVVYCIGKAERAKLNGLNKLELHGDNSVCALDGMNIGVFTKAEFDAQFIYEHAPMPEAVKELFDGKPSFAEWWDAKNEAKP